MARGLGEMLQDWTKKHPLVSYPHEVNRNPNADFRAGPGSENPGIFVLLCGGREGISWPQRVVPLIPSSLLLSGSVLDRQHKSRCCSSSAELIPCSREVQTSTCLTSALSRPVFLRKHRYYHKIVTTQESQQR